MNSKEAIELLNSKHLSIVTTTEGQYFATGWSDGVRCGVTELSELIQQQDKMMELACKSATSCAYPGQDCPDILPNLSCADCWRKYLQSEVSK